jgi:hypothetical protein
MGSRGKALAAGSRGVSAHTPGGVWGAEPQNAKTKHLDHPTPKQADPHWPRTLAACKGHGALPVGTTAPYRSMVHRYIARGNNSTPIVP